MHRKYIFKKMSARVLSLLLCLFVSASAITVLAEGERYVRTETVAPGLTYTKTSFTENGVSENTFTFEYSFSEATALKFLHGDYIYGFNTLGKMIENEKASFSGGENIVGGINADFFSMKTGVPMSALVSDGELLSTDDARPALGIYSDGTAFIGTPNFTAKLEGESFSYPIGHINKYPTPYSVYLLTDKFSTATKTDYPSTEIVLMPVSEEYSEETYREYVNEAFSQETDTAEPFPFENYFAETKLTPRCSVEVAVTQVRTSNQNGEIPKGCFVLTADDRPYKDIFSVVSVGQKYKITVDCGDEWAEVENAVGGSVVLVKNGGVQLTESDSLYTARQPRSAVGIKSGGTLVFCAVDGRRAGYSNGMTAAELSDYMLSLGCTDVLNLDGGGSTTVFAALPGDDEKLVNRPTDGTQRGISDAAVFVNKSVGDGNVFGMRMNLSDFYVLGGGTKVKLPELLYAYDSAYKPLGKVSTSEGLLFAADDLGTVEDGFFVSADTDGKSTVMFSLMDENGSTSDYAAASINITNSPDVLTLSPEDKSVARGHYTTLHVSATKNTLPVIADVGTLWFSVNGAAFAPLPYSDEYCSIDEKGDLTVSETCPADDFEVSVAAGTVSASAKITVREDLFADMRGHWARRVSEFVYKNGIMDGITSDGKRYFKPDSTVNTAQLAAMTARYLKLDTSKYADFNFEEKLGITFAATDSTIWSRPYIAALAESGMIDSLFEKDGDIMIISADRPISRIDAMRILGKLVSVDTEAENTVSSADYADMSKYAGDKYEDLVDAALSAGLFGGYPDGTLRPDVLLTRAQTAAVFMRLYN